MGTLRNRVPCRWIMHEHTAAADPGHVAAMAERADAGDRSAKDALFASLYSELHRLAQGHLRQGGTQLTMSPTTLLHEAYLDLSGRSSIAFLDRLRFLKYASRAMRHLIIDYIRTRRAQKRGGEFTFIAGIQDEVQSSASAASLDTLGDALDQLARLDPPLAELVDLKFFCGFSFGDIAAMRGVSERTVQRDWAKARLLLHDALHPDADEHPGRS
jgi:RNA polymerase sigma factor (TIGR02999 family)